MIVEIINDDSMWTAGQVSCVSLEKNDMAIILTVRTSGDCGTQPYPLYMEEAARIAYNVIASGFLEERLTGVPVVYQIENGQVEKIPIAQAGGNRT